MFKTFDQIYMDNYNIWGHLLADIEYMKLVREIYDLQFYALNINNTSE
jgi:hypothetical protein